MLVSPSSTLPVPRGLHTPAAAIPVTEHGPSGLVAQSGGTRITRYRRASASVPLAMEASLAAAHGPSG